MVCSLKCPELRHRADTLYLEELGGEDIQNSGIVYSTLHFFWVSQAFSHTLIYYHSTLWNKHYQPLFTDRKTKDQKSEVISPKLASLQTQASWSKINAFHRAPQGLWFVNILVGAQQGTVFTPDGSKGETLIWGCLWGVGRAQRTITEVGAFRGPLYWGAVTIPKSWKRKGKMECWSCEGAVRCAREGGR